jgi:hypothetical protein
LSGRSDLGSTLDLSAYRPPLSYLPAALLFLATGPSLTVLRLTVLLQFLLAVWLVYDLGLRTTRSRQAGFLAAVLVGTLPMTFGWGRMGYAETGMSLLVLLALRVLVSCELQRIRDGLRLGLAVGLGMLTKVAFPIFALGPLVWSLCFRVRTRRQLAILGLSAGVAALAISWWYIPQWHYVVTNIGMSSHAPISSSQPAATLWLSRLLSYTIELEGAFWLLSLALVGSLLAWRLKSVPAPMLALLSLSTWPPLALILFFHQSRRYPLPVYWIAGLLAGVCLQTLLARTNRKLATTAVVAISALLLGDFVALNMGWRSVQVPPGSARQVAGERVDGVGLITPDRRSFDEYPAALEAAKKRSSNCLIVFSGVRAHELFAARDQLYRVNRADRRPVELSLDWKDYRDRRPTATCVLAVTGRTGQDRWDRIPITEHVLERLCLSYARFARVGGRRRLGTWGVSPLGLQYALYRIDPAELEREVKLRPRRCRLKQIFWDEEINR